MKHFTFIFLHSTILFASCEKDCPAGHPLDELVYFQYEAKNYAWGLYHAGWYIDQGGNFNYYNLPASWNEPDSLGYISKEDLLENLEKADTVIYQVSQHELQNQARIIDFVDDDSFSEIQHVGADIGRLDLFCFQWNPILSKYKRILLATSGDFSQFNKDPEAMELTTWLIAQGELSGYFNWFQ
jgi:hypothetical protein